MGSAKTATTTTKTLTQLETATDMIGQAPPGELIEVIDGKICGHEFLSQLSPIISEANMKNCIAIQIPLPDGQEKKCLITPYNKIEEDTYQYDEFQFKLNPFSLEVSNVINKRTTTIEEEMADYASIRETIESMIKKSYKTEGLCWNMFNQKGKDFLAIVIVGEHFKSENYINAQWRSIWIVDKETHFIKKATINVMVHYFEDGNIQLNVKRNIDQEANYSISDMKKIEDEVLSMINDRYYQLSENTFKRLRRQLPLTRTKINWEKLAGYKCMEGMKVEDDK